MTASGLRGLVAAIAAISIFAFGVSLTIPLFAILLNRMGASGFEIGLSGAAAAIAMVVSGPVLPVLLRHTTLPRMIIASILAMAVLLLIFPLVPGLWIWIALRFCFGFAAVAVFFGSELWIVSAAPPARRGLFIGIYGVFLALGFMAGPVLLSVIGTQGILPFLVGAAICLIAIPPMLWAARDTPDLSDEGPPAGFWDIFQFFRTDPALMWAVTLFGAVEFGAMGLIPVWSLRVGLDEQAALTLIALLAAGNVVLNVPLGLIGDRFDRRRMLAICALICLGAAILAPYLAFTTWPLWLLTAFWGGMAVGLYIFALSELGARYSGAALARGAGAIMMAYGIGALVSPPIMGAALDLWPPHGMFRVLAVAAAAYLLLLLLRRRRTA